MSDSSLMCIKLPHLADELIWRIIAKTDPKTAGRCRSLSRGWNFKLCTPLFLNEHFRENKDCNRSVITGIGYPPNDENSIWFVRAFLDSGHQVQFDVPVDINQYGFYALIGSDYGNVCLRISMGGLNSHLLIWNPLTRKRRYARDEASTHAGHALSLYAFGFLHDTVEYRIIHAYKKFYSQTTLSWSLYTSFERDWTHSGTFETSVQKIGPKYVINEGVFYWIGWAGPNLADADSIVTFNLLQRMFHEAVIPVQVKSDYHALTNFNDGVGFVTYHNIGFTRQVMVWQLKSDWDSNLNWEKMSRVSGFGIPYTPSLFVGKDIILVLEARSGHGCSNDSEAIDVILSRLRYMEGRRENLVYRTWHDHVNVKTITLHSEGLFMV
ncbi:hypothetical protein Ahy_B05g075793 [Arachis hypogaea]|uniref:F-box associated beta-propeller type 1 domain-containing protein n=1 Tax=Arachis hypogaea TaxID=3818 RepID=A0A444Z217_ARAHY|nr:hypothetical protein Ahy_B05g075793 [Arachis hypogaea]